MSKVLIPEPLPIKAEITYSDQITWYEVRISQLESTAIKTINDRIELRKRCK